MLDRFTLEVIAKTEITQHLEKGVMARGVTNVIEIIVLATGPNTTLRGYRPLIGALVLAQEYILELDHTGIGEEQRGIVMRYQRAAGNDLVTVIRKVIEEFLPDIPGFHDATSVKKEAVRPMRRPGQG